MRLSRKIFLASLLPFLLIALTYHYLTTTLFSDYLTENYRSQAASRLQQLEDDILPFFAEYENQLRAVARIMPFDPAKEDQARQILYNYLQHDDLLIRITAINLNGREWLRINRSPALVEEQESPGSFFYSPIYQEPLLSMEPYLDFPRLSPDFALPFIDISIPVKNQLTGRISGVLWLRIYSQTLQGILENSLPSMGKVMLLEATSGEVILQADDTRQNYGRAEQKIIGKIHGDTRLNGWLEGEQNTFLFRKFSFGGRDMTLLYYQPHKNIYYLADQLSKYNLRVIFVGVALFILASFFLIRATISPLTRVTEQITELGRRYRHGGKPVTGSTEERSVDEIKDLRDSFAILQEQLATYSAEMEAEIKVRKETETKLLAIQNQLEKRIKERTKTIEKTHQQLLHAEKLATSGSIAASIAHEFGNPLCGIKAVLTSIAKKDSLPTGEARMVAMALDECDRMNALIQNLLDFNRPSTGEMSLTNLHRTIDDVVILFRQNLERNRIAIAKEYDPTLLPIMAITDQIKQVIMNLISNSIDACKDGGVITIRTRAEAKSVFIYLSDTGQGVKSDDLPRIFDPFFTTKPIAMGTGLGLSVCYGIIRRHGGTIEAVSEPGEGATFAIMLPINAAG